MPIAPRIEAPKGYGSSGSIRSALERLNRAVNLPLLLSLLLLTAYGLLIVYSAILNRGDFSFSRQIMGVIVGLVLMVLLWRFDYHRLANWVVPLLVIDFILIISPLFPIIGVNVNGASSWIKIFGQQIQPAEPAKIISIVVMAALVSRYRGKLDSAKDYLKCLAVLLALMVAIMLQPDMGTAMVFFAFGMTIFLVGGTNWRFLVITLVVIVAAVALLFFIDPILDKAVGHDVLIKQYQKDRLLVFMDESIDPAGIGYNLKHAKIAIGSGGVFGKGLFEGTQQGLGFLPEAPTDFIFCVLAEELGFMGCMGLLAIYAALIGSSFYIAFKSDDHFGTYVIMGIIGMWAFQIMENIGMTCGLMPITGIPLPFISYGSSFMLTNFMALGMIFSVWSHRSIQKGL